MTLFYANAIKLTTATIIVLCIVVCGLLLLFFWRRHVTASYEENVKGRETEINEKSVEFYERQNEELKRQNDELANVIHRDNKLLAALEADGALSGDLKELYRDRKDVLENYRKEDGRVPQTGINALDAVIGYLINRAEGEGIALTFKSSPAAARALCSKIYDNLALNTLFCDLGENAILALKGRQGGKIVIEIGEENGLPFASFSDGGEPFPAEIIAEAGLSRVTSRKDDGGSGRGLMSTMEILKHFGATFFLDELEQGDDLVKTIKICWGMPRLFVVRSHREYLHAFCSARSDMGCITQTDEGQLKYYPPHEEYLRAAADARVGKINKPHPSSATPDDPAEPDEPDNSNNPDNPDNPRPSSSDPNEE